MPGWLTNGLVGVTLPFTGSETLPLDTNLASGANPQTEAATLLQLKGYMFGGGSFSPTTTVPTASCTGTGATSTATLNAGYGVLTTAALTTAAAATHTITLTNSSIAATSVVIASCGLGTATTGEPAVHSIVPGAGTCTIAIRNDAAAAAVNGTLKVFFLVIN